MVLNPGCPKASTQNPESFGGPTHVRTRGTGGSSGEGDLPHLLLGSVFICPVLREWGNGLWTPLLGIQGASIGIHSPTPCEAPDSKGPPIDPSIDPCIGSLSRNPKTIPSFQPVFRRRFDLKVRRF